MIDTDYAQARQALGSTDRTPFGINRRRFLQASMAVGGAATLLPGWMQDIFAHATPLGATDGIVVLVMMGGGVDGLNMVPPIGDSAYYALRPTLAVPANAALNIGSGLGLHPNLTNVKKYWDNGRAAIVQGVGVPTNPDLSHFSSMANWMMASTNPNGTGWIGRYLDSIGGDSIKVVSLDTNVPLHMIGATARGTGLPDDINGAMGVDQTNGYDRREYQAIRNLASAPTGLGPLADALAMVGKSTIDLGARVAGAYTGTQPDNYFAKKMALAARLINLDLGIRVINVEQGDFDHHDAEQNPFSDRMTELNDGLGQFFSNLSLAFLNRVTVVTFSEFGRRPEQNDSGGTDHGTANNLLVIGNRVKGGLYGTRPSLTSLDDNSNLIANVPFQSVYASVLESWLHTDSSAILGAQYTNLNLFEGVGDSGASGNGVGGGVAAAGVGGSTPSTNAFSNMSATSGYWMATQGGELYRFGNASDLGSAGAGAPIAALVSMPGRDGAFVARVDGVVQALGSAKHAGDMSGKFLARSIVGMAVHPDGGGYWLLGGDGGVFSFGDANFFGSTGAMRLNQPVVGMAATPTGNGYWFVAADGGVFSFGDAAFHGSMGSTRLNQPVVGMASTASGQGYWLVAADGGIFSFGDAAFHGSTGGLKLNRPIVGMSRSASGNGYMFVATDGGVFCFGDAQFQGSLGASTLPTPVAALAG